jgi:signal peptidase II
MKNHLRWLVVVGIVASTIGCDRITKDLAARNLANAPDQSFLADTFRLRYVENRGGFLGLGGDLPAWSRAGLFTVGSAVMLVLVAVALPKHRTNLQLLLGLGLLWAGGSSNLLDRVARGSVVDFMNVGVGSVRTGIFNIADLAVMAGIVLLVAGHRRLEKRGPRHG